jgi:hypothetical protein
MAVIQIWSTCACNNKPSRLGKSYLCHCVQVYALCRKPEVIFKHIGVKTWTQTLRTMALKSQKIKKWSEIHETLLDAMTWNQDVVVKKLACLTKVLIHTSHKSEHLTRRLVVPRGNNMHVWWRAHGQYLLRPLIFFLWLTSMDTNVMFKVEIFWGWFDLFETLNEFLSI